MCVFPPFVALFGKQNNNNKNELLIMGIAFKINQLLVIEIYYTFLYDFYVWQPRRLFALFSVVAAVSLVIRCAPDEIYF